MKVLNARVNWNLEWDNDPHLEVLVDHIPPLEALTFHHHEWAYYAHLDGYVKFFAYTGQGDGYGGRGFTLNMADGTQKTLKGPWSSRAGAINALRCPGLPPTLDVSMTDDHDVWLRGYTFYAASCTVESILKYFTRSITLPIWELRPESGPGAEDIVWQPLLRKRYTSRILKKFFGTQTPNFNRKSAKAQRGDS